MLARAFGQRLAETLGQSVVIENKGGAGGSIGAESVARAAPDGHTLLFHNLSFSSTTVALQLAGRARHDIAANFVPVALAANVPMLVVGAQALPVTNLREFIAHARAANPPLHYGSTGPGSVMNLAIEVMKRDAGVALDHVPFRGAAPLVQELIAGRIALGGDQLSTSLEFVRAGSLKPLATLAAERIPLLPAVPTVAELGLKNMELHGWNGFFAPAGTPAAVVQRINDAVNKAAADPTLKSRLADVGAQAVVGPASLLGDVVSAQVEKVRPLIADLKLAIS
jgi:tripartite-type tricarboxylate transporter receptor subunit TctC